MKSIIRRGEKQLKMVKICSNYRRYRGWHILTHGLMRSFSNVYKSKNLQTLVICTLNCVSKSYVYSINRFYVILWVECRKTAKRAGPSETGVRQRNNQSRRQWKTRNNAQTRTGWFQTKIEKTKSQSEWCQAAESAGRGIFLLFILCC